MRDFETLIDALGWKPRYVEEYFEVSRQTIYRWKKENAPSYVIKHLEIIARIMGV